MTINTLYELARNSVEKFASKVAFSMFEGDDVTYAEVGRRIAKVQEILKGAELPDGEKVPIQNHNSNNWAIGKLAETANGRTDVQNHRDFTGVAPCKHITHAESG